MDKELLEYIKGESAQGIPLEDIKRKLLVNKWGAEEVDKAIIYLFSSNSEIEERQKQKIENLTEFKMADPYPPIEDKSKQKRNIYRGIFILIIALFFTALSVYGYYAGYFNATQKTASETLNMVLDSRSFSFNSQVIVDWSQMDNAIFDELSGDLSTARQMTVSSEGKYEFFQKDNFKSSNQISFILGAVNASLESRILDNTFYFQIKELPKLSIFNTLTFLEGQWIKFPMEQAGFSNATNLVANYVNALPDIPDEETRTKLINGIYDLTKNANLFQIVKKLPLENIDGVKSYHFVFTLDQIGIQNYLNELNNYLKNNLPDENFVLENEEIDQILNQIVQNTKGDIWIDRKTNFPTKLTIQMNLNNPELPEDGFVKIDFTSFFKDWNKPINVETPPDAITFEELLSV